MKKSLSLLLALAMLLVLAMPAVVSAEGGHIKILLDEDRGEDSALYQIMNAWAEATGNTYEFLIVPYDDQLTKFPQMIRNNDLPDLIVSTRLHQLYPDEFVDMATLVDLSVMEPTALKIVGKAYSSDKVTGLTLSFTTTCIFVNKTAFEKAGIEVPAIGSEWTWDELYANAKFLQEKGGVKYGFACDVSRARYDCLMYANGGSLTVLNDGQIGISVNSEQNIATLQAFIDANESGVMPKALWAGGTTDNPADYFQNGDVGIYLSGSWNYAGFASGIKDFTMAVMPSPKGTVERAAIIGGEGFAIPNAGANREVAESFVKWLYTAENFQKFINIEKGPSGFVGVSYEPDNEYDAANVAVIQNEVAAIPDSYMIDEASAWRNYLDNEYRDLIKQAVAGEYSAEEALTEFAEELSDKSGWPIVK